MSDVGHIAIRGGIGGRAIYIDGWGIGPFLVKSESGKQSWLFEFSDKFGPVLVDMYGDPTEHQPIRESHPFWKPFHQWLAQSRRQGFPKPVLVRERRQ